MKKIGFDSDRYVKEQTRYILERVHASKGRLYIECGGKLLHDLHASRVLPGFDPNAKMKVFQSLKEHLDIIICIYAGDIEKRKIRGDFGISYDADVLKMIDDFASYDLKCNKVVITRFEGQASAVLFKEKLERMGINVYTHRATPGYPSNIDLVVSQKGMERMNTFLWKLLWWWSMHRDQAAASLQPALTRCITKPGWA